MSTLAFFSLWEPTGMDINQWKGGRNEVNGGEATAWRKQSFRVQQQEEGEKMLYCERMKES